MAIHAQSNVSLNTIPAHTSLLGGHFIYKSSASSSGLTLPSANIIQNLQDNPTDWGYNVNIGANGIKIRHNEITLSDWTANNLTFYRTALVDSNYVQGKKAIVLGEDALTFYKPLAYNSSEEPKAIASFGLINIIGQQNQSYIKIINNGISIMNSGLSLFDVTLNNSQQIILEHNYDFGEIVEFPNSELTSYDVDGYTIKYPIIEIDNVTFSTDIELKELEEALDDFYIHGTMHEYNLDGTLTEVDLNFNMSTDSIQNIGLEYILKAGHEDESPTIDNTIAISVSAKHVANSNVITFYAVCDPDSNFPASFGIFDLMNLKCYKSTGLPILTLGAQDTSHIKIDYHSMQMIDKDGDIYFYISDLRGADGTAEISETFIAGGHHGIIYPTYDYIRDVVSIKIDGISVSDYTFTSTQIRLATIPPENSVIEVIYKTAYPNLKVYTLGKRKANEKSGAFSIAEGYNVVASGPFSYAEGRSTIASGQISRAEGSNTKASGDFSHAEGNSTIASGDTSHAEGYSTIASGRHSHAEGEDTEASESASHAEGEDTEASGTCSHAEGYNVVASGSASHAEGHSTIASGLYSHASGWKTIAADTAQTAIGKYNIEHGLEDIIAFVIGNGYNSLRSDALTVDWNGNVNIASGAKYKINGVALSAADVGAIPISRTINSKALSSDITLSAADVGAIALSDKYTRSSVGNLDWSNNTEGDSKVIMKSALAFWNGAYSGTSSNLTYCNKGAFGTLATKNSLSASDVGALPTDYFIFDTYSKSITVGQGATNITIDTLTQHSGYTLRGYINQNGGYTDQWLVSYGTYGPNVVAMVYSKYNGSLTQTISCTAVWTKN